MVGGPSIVFTKKTVVNETLVRFSANLRKSRLGIDASLLTPSQCVKKQLLVFSRVGTSIQSLVDSDPTRTR